MRFAWGAAAYFALTSVAMTWPMAVDLTAHYTSRQDFYLNLWILDWVARWLTEPGLSLFWTQALYHPLGTSLATQDLTLVQTIAAAPLTRLCGPVVAFNALVLFSFWLAGFATALWIRALTGDSAAGLLGGAIYTFAPYHLLYIPQLGMVAIGFVPLFLLADLTFTRAPSAGRAALAGLALAVVGLGAWYYGVCAGLVALVLSGARIVRAGAARARSLRLEAVYWLTCGLALAPVVLQMLPAFVGHPALEGGEERTGMALIMPAFKGTTSTVALWSFLGFVPLALGALGVARRTAVLLLMTLGFLVLSMGESLSVGGVRITLPYAWLQALPAVSAVRYPDRFFLMTQLGAAALAGFGLVALRRRLSLRPAAVGVVMLLPLLEFWPGPLPSVHPDAWPPVPALATAPPGAVLCLPTAFSHMDGEQMAQATVHHRPIVGGYLMRRDLDLVRSMQHVPGVAALLEAPAPLSDAIVDQLAEAGIRYVFLQKAPWVMAPDVRPHALLAPFCVAGRPLLRQRLFARYARHGLLAATAEHWAPLLEAALGTPLATTDRGAVFEVRPHAGAADEPR
jgi:hypothetical protein